MGTTSNKTELPEQGKTNDNGHVAALQQEKSFLRDYCVRLSKELLQHQEQCPNKESTTIVRDSSLSEIELPEWMFDSSVMSPLFSSYDNRIRDLSNLIQEQGTCLDRLTEALQAKKEDHQPPLRVQPLHSKSNNLAGELSSSDLQLLEEQAELLAQEVNEARQTILTRDKSIAELTEDLQSKLQYIQKMDERIKGLEKRNRHLQNKLSDSTKYSSKLKFTVEDLTIKLNESHALQSNSEDNMKRIVESKNELEVRNNNLQTKITNLSKELCALQSHLGAATSDYERLNVEFMEQSKALAKIKKELSCSKFCGRGNEKTVELQDKIRELEVSKETAEAKANILEATLKQMRDINTSLSDSLGIDSTISCLKEHYDGELNLLTLALQSEKKKVLDLECTLEGKERALTSLQVEKQSLQKAMESQNSRQTFEELQRSIESTQQDLIQQKKLTERIRRDLAKLEGEKKRLLEQAGNIETKYNDARESHEKKRKLMEGSIQTLQLKTDEILRNESTSTRQHKEDLRILHEQMENLKFEQKTKVLELEKKLCEKEELLKQTSNSLQVAQKSNLLHENQGKKDLEDLKSRLKRAMNMFEELNTKKEKILKHLQASNFEKDKACVELEKAVFQKENLLNSNILSLQGSKGELLCIKKQFSKLLEEQQMRIENERYLKIENHVLQQKLKQ
ncbi:predicted protein [Chaetoceros tenuissimus]|uniref:Uncharacterized protein n=1 Tax=Chaetoceros tenuissimus TaxID=426638 RepID=A0AAD3CDV4_9STRA|nr:predicted protein [Chaetoceros tenuissimus]